jgi:predicted lysophospholipase L1 biosynthesis ABC-type transport system permease subunit
MFITTQKEEYSYAYISAVASAAGYSFQIAPRPLDLVGVDVTITGLVSPGSRRRTRLDLQLKCTSTIRNFPKRDMKRSSQFAITDKKALKHT